ncbi:MAG: HpcH/HpaI aldolase/citrate lyase family protein [Dehalococcoidia bacterium]
MNVLRTMLFVPGSRQNMIERARELEPDAILFDLEDSVPTEEKARAREQVRTALSGFVRPRRQLWVRLNSTYTNLTKDDIRAVLVPELDGLLLPKADSAAIVRYVEGLLRDQEPRAGVEAGKTRLIAAIESAAGLLRSEETARASPRLIALAFGAEDYTADMSIVRTASGEELQYPRSVIAVVARATNLMALDTVYPHLHDDDGLLHDAEVARRAGFQGKLLIHPEQIEPVRRVFTPSAEQVEQARRIVAAYKEATEQGHGAVQVDGAMVDAPVATRAQRLLDRVEEPAPEPEPVPTAPRTEASGPP